jgi:hypothetical protein
MHKGGHQSEPCTLTIFDLLCSPHLLTPSASLHFERGVEVKVNAGLTVEVFLVLNH